jgi:hypothetical protein
MAAAMTSQARDWMGAASCSEGPRRTIRFSDLPRKHQREVLRLTVTAAMSVAFFIVLVVVPRTLSSRSLASRVALLDPQTRAVPVVPPLRTAVPDVHRNDRLVSRAQTARIRQQPSSASSPELVPVDASPESVAVDMPPIPQPARSRNPLSRFVHAVFHASAVIASGPGPDPR